RATRGSLIRATKRSIADWLYQVTWIERPRDRPASPVDAAGTWVIVAGRDDLARDLADALERSGAAVTVAGSGEGLGEVVRTAGEGGRIAGIVDCRPLDATGAASSDAILAAAERMLGGALDLVHAAVGLESPAARGLVILTLGAVPLGGGGDPDELRPAPLPGVRRSA